MANRFFHKTVSTEPKQGGHGVPTFAKVLFVLLVISLSTILALQFIGEAQKWYRNWNEIAFALNHPNVVQTIRVDYEKKQADLDQAFLKRDKTSEEKLIDEVVTRLQKADQLK